MNSWGAVSGRAQKEMRRGMWGAAARIG